MTLKTVFKQCNTKLCLINRLNVLGDNIVIAFVDETLMNRDKQEFMHTIECI